MKKFQSIPALLIVLIITSCKSPVADTIESAIKQDGIDKAVELYYQIKLNEPDNYDFNYSGLFNLGTGLAQKGQIRDGIKILELAAEEYPDSINIYPVLSRAYFKLNDRQNSIKYFNKFKNFVKPTKLDDIIYMKKLFFVDESFSVPIFRKTDNFVLRPLTAEHVDLDYAAVMSSKDHIKSIMITYPPENLTKEDNLKSLKYHEYQFKTRTGFVYTVLNNEETECFGCVYISPSRLDNFKAEIIMWTTKEQYDKGLDPKLFNAVEGWMKNDWPFENVVYPGRSMDWKEFYTLLEEQDKQYN